MFLGTWLIVSFIIDTAYVGILTSILAVPKVTTPVDSLEDLLSYGKIPWLLEEGTSLHQMMEEAQEGIYKEVNDRKAGLVYSGSCYISRAMVRIQRVAIICDILAMRKAIHDDFSQTGECFYHIARNPLFQASIAYAFPKGSPITEEFNRWLTPLKESGVINKQVLESTSNATTCLSNKGQGQGQGNPVLVFMDLAGTFLLWLGALFLSLLFFLGEIGTRYLER
ncbi:uncharacterized protein [Palaemon carinicauda]|uniref:uncharacterized protein n=1 Tax=Palaemon carinicauda TaxID=392227 RepID=UPI0035B5B590